MVEPEKLNDNEAAVLAREVTKRIENELEYPGQIKVTVLKSESSNTLNRKPGKPPRWTKLLRQTAAKTTKAKTRLHSTNAVEAKYLPKNNRRPGAATRTWGGFVLANSRAISASPLPTMQYPDGDLARR